MTTGNDATAASASGAALPQSAADLPVPERRGLSITASLLAPPFVLLSSACCVGPLAVVLSFVGIGGGTLLTLENTFGPYRSYVLTATALLLAVGFREAYRPLEACAPGKACAVPGNRRLQRISLWVATVMLMTLLYFTYVHPNLDVYFGIYA